MPKSPLKNQIPSPFLKWAGGKTQLLKQYTPYFPGEYGKYFEPFLGGGAVFFYLKPENALLSDYNEELVNCYRVVRDKPMKLMELLRKHRERHNEGQEEYYYFVRSMVYDSLSFEEKAARTIYLNKTGYNGLYRLNSLGEFNVPFGRYKNPGIFDEENILAVSGLLKGVDIEKMDYRDVLIHARRGDLIYLDPPYHPLSNTSNFTSYTENSFDYDDQENLAKLYHELDKKGCLVMLSNSDSPPVRRLYEKYHMVEIQANRAINSRADRRGAVGELLVLNFETVAAKTRGKRKPARAKSKYWRPWETLFEKCVDDTRPVNFIKAKSIKKETGLEPRLMAKFDSRDDLPPVFREKGVFLLPAANGEYMVVKGEGYCDVKPIKEPPEDYTGILPFDLGSAGCGRGEMQHIDYACNCGLLSHFTGVETLFLTIRGRKYSGEFSFRAGEAQDLHVSGVQMEVDAGYEGKDEIIIIEAKMGAPSSFNIRQLYYPFRDWGERMPHKKIRPMLLLIDYTGETYSFYEYRFRDKFDYNSIELVKAGSYRVVEKKAQETALPLDLFKTLDTQSPADDSRLPASPIYIPQANDVSKIMEFPFRVFEGYDTAQKVAEAFEFTPRQSSYYREAAENLGFIATGTGGGYSLTPLGERFVSAPVEKRNRLFARRMMELPVVKEIMCRLFARRSLSMRDIVGIIAECSSLAGQTPRRRAGTLRAWFWWLYSAVGIVKVGRERIFLG